jgi:hypothetical protein
MFLRGDAGPPGGCPKMLAGTNQQAVPEQKFNQ